MDRHSTAGRARPAQAAAPEPGGGEGNGGGEGEPVREAEAVGGEEHRAWRVGGVVALVGPEGERAALELPPPTVAGEPAEASGADQRDARAQLSQRRGV